VVAVVVVGVVVGDAQEAAGDSAAAHEWD